MAVISKKNTQRLEEVLSVLMDKKIEVTLITLNKIMDALNKNCPSAHLSGMVFEAIEARGLVPNIITMNCYLESFATLGNLEKVFEIFEKLTTEIFADLESKNLGFEP